MNNLCLPCVQGCTMNDPLVKKDILVREIIFTYRCSNKCKICHLPSIDHNTMSPELALSVIRESLIFAKKNGYSKVHIHFTGGEIFDAFDEFKAVYESLTDKELQKLVIFIETCGGENNDEKINYLLANPKIRVRLRWNDNFRHRDAFTNSDYLTEKLNVDSVYLPVLKRDFKYLVGDLCILYLNRKYCMPSYCIYEGYRDNDYKLYKSQIERLAGFKHEKFKLNALEILTANNNICMCSLTPDKNKQMEVIDFNGKRYSCKFMSPMYSLSSVFKKAYRNTQRPTICDNCEAKEVCVLCPASLVLRSEYQCNLLRLQYNALKEAKKSKPD